MRDEEVFENTVFKDTMRAEDWTHLAGNGAAARAKSVGLRRVRYAGVAGATVAVAVGVTAIAGTFGGGNSPVQAGSVAVPTKVASSSPAPSPATSPAPVPGTMGAVFEQWKSCPDSELTVEGTLPQDPPHLQQNWRDACRRDIATLSALLPDYDVTPAVSAVKAPATMNPHVFDNPSFVIPSGDVPNMGPNLYRIVGKDGVTTNVTIRAYNQDDNTKPISGEDITLSNGLKARLTLGTDLQHKGQLGYEIYILSQGKTFYMVSWGSHPNFDFKAVATSPQFADLAAKALAEPDS
jgi:hypothetical protein